MTNKKLTIFCWLALCLVFSSRATAQADFNETIIVDLKNNAGAVSFKPQMSSVQANAETPALSVVNLKQQVISSENGFQRILIDEANRVLFGYDLKVGRNQTDSRFEVTFEPLRDTALSVLNEKFIKTSNSNRPFRLLTLHPVSAPQMLADGETVALDLLVNSQIGIKIADKVRVASSRDMLMEFPVRDFTLKEIHLAARASYLKVNDESFTVGNRLKRYDGSLLWFYLPEKGFFVVSLEPHEGYNFQPTGILNGNKISFRDGDNQYEWNSSEAFLPIEGAWRVWILHVKNYIPPTVALSIPIKRNEEYEKSSIEKASEQTMEVLKRNNPLDLDMSRKRGSIDAARLRKKMDLPNESPIRVAAGSATSLESLIPKN